MNISLRMVKSGIVYTHDGNGRVSEAWKLSWLERIVMMRIQRKIRARKKNG